MNRSYFNNSASKDEPMTTSEGQLPALKTPRKAE